MICNTNRALFSGEVLLPNGNICDATSRPIECSSKEDTQGFALQKSNTNDPPSYSWATDGTEYKCCLPYSCGNTSTDIFIANIYGKWIL